MSPVRKGSVAYREMVLSPAIWTILQAETYFNKIVRLRDSLQRVRKILASCKLPSQGQKDPSTGNKPDENGGGSISS